MLSENSNNSETPKRKKDKITEIKKAHEEMKNISFFFFTFFGNSFLDDIGKN